MNRMIRLPAATFLDPVPQADTLDYYGLLNDYHWIGLERDHPSQPWFYLTVSRSATTKAGMIEDSRGRDKDLMWALTWVVKTVESDIRSAPRP